MTASATLDLRLLFQPVNAISKTWHWKITDARQRTICCRNWPIYQKAGRAIHGLCDAIFPVYSSMTPVDTKRADTERHTRPIAVGGPLK